MEKTQKQVLNKFSDVVSLNAFIATTNEAHLVYKVSKLSGLWQLDLIAEEKSWSIGHYVDGLEDRSVEYDVFVKRYWHGYVDVAYADDDHLYVVRWQNGFIFVTLPNERQKEVVIVAPQVCGRHVDPLQEPVYIWRDASGRYYVLDCANKLYEFETLDDLENWIKKELRMRREWYVIPGKLSSKEEWNTVVRKAKMGDHRPNPDEVVEIIRRLT